MKIPMKNILITSAGQRVKLTQIFMESAKSLGLDSKVFTTDLNPRLAPACYISDKTFDVCRCTDPLYIEELMLLCLDNQVGIIIPTIDTELRVLSDNKEKFLDNGIFIIAPDSHFVSICRDKRKTIAYMESIGIPMPKAVDIHHPVFPIFAKPYDGSLSTNIHIIRSEEDLTSEILNDPKLIFMEYIGNDFKEFTVDMYYGRDNEVKEIVPRERIKVRAGEINKGITRKNYIVDFLKQRMGKIPGVVGCLCLQLFYRESDNQIYGIEINPRFGGGYPLTYHAKANYPEYILREYFLNQNIEYTDSWISNTLMLRYDQEVISYE